MTSMVNNHGKDFDYKKSKQPINNSQQNSNINYALGGKKEINKITFLEFSVYVTEGQIQYIESLPDDMWFLSLGYSAGDVQPPSITGTRWYNESWLDCVNRELCEESGLKLLPNKKYDFGGKIFNNKKTKLLYGLNIKDTRVVSNNTYSEQGKDNWRNKICIIVYGTKEEMLNRLQKIIDFPKNDGIDSAYIMSKKHAINIHKKAWEMGYPFKKNYYKGRFYYNFVTETTQEK